MTHEYTTAGEKYVNIENLACAPELDRLYTIEEVGDDVSNDQAGFAYDGGIFWFDQVSADSFDISSISVDWDDMLRRLDLNVAGTTIRLDDDADEDVVKFILPAGPDISECAVSAADIADEVLFPLQTGSMMIQAGAFKDFTKLKEIYVPPYVSAIEPGAFEGCSSLYAVYIPSTLSGCISSITDDIGFNTTNMYDVKMQKGLNNGGVQIGDAEIDLTEFLNENGNTLLRAADSAETQQNGPHPAGFVLKHSLKLYKREYILSTEIYNTFGIDRYYSIRINQISLTNVDRKYRNFIKNKVATVEADLKSDYDVSIPNNLRQQLFEKFKTFQSLSVETTFERYNDPCCIIIKKRGKTPAKKENKYFRKFSIKQPYPIKVFKGATISSDNNDPLFSGTVPDVYAKCTLEIKGDIYWVETPKLLSSTSRILNRDIIVAGGLSADLYTHNTYPATYYQTTPHQLYDGSKLTKWHMDKDWNQHYISGQILFNYSNTSSDWADLSAQTKDAINQEIKKALSGWGEKYGSEKSLYENHDKECPNKSGS